MVVHRLHRCLPLAAIGLLVLWLSACRGEPTDLSVELCGDAAVPQTLDAVRVTILDEERQQMRERVLELLVCPEGRVRSLPRTLDFRPFDGEAWGVVQGLKDGVEVLHYERRFQMSRDEPTALQLALNADCRGISCPLGQTCQAGECNLAPRKSQSATVCASANPGDTMPDAGIRKDASMGATTDTGSPDTGGSVAPERLCPGYDAGTPSDAGDAPAD